MMLSEFVSFDTTLVCVGIPFLVFQFLYFCISAFALWFGWVRLEDERCIVKVSCQRRWLVQIYFFNFLFLFLYLYFMFLYLYFYISVFLYFYFLYFCFPLCVGQVRGVLLRRVASVDSLVFVLIFVLFLYFYILVFLYFCVSYFVFPLWLASRWEVYCWVELPAAMTRPNAEIGQDYNEQDYNEGWNEMENIFHKDSILFLLFLSTPIFVGLLQTHFGTWVYVSLCAKQHFCKWEGLNNMDEKD